jgi:hypothetical protein
MTLSGTITASGSLELQSPRIVALGDVGTGTDTLAVEVLDSQRGLAVLSDGEIIFLVLVWLYALVLPWLGTALPPELHAIVTDGYATIGIALAITWRILDKKR